MLIIAWVTCTTVLSLFLVWFKPKEIIYLFLKLSFLRDILLHTRVRRVKNSILSFIPWGSITLPGHISSLFNMPFLVFEFNIPITYNDTTYLQWVSMGPAMPLRQSSLFNMLFLVFEFNIPITYNDTTYLVCPFIQNYVSKQEIFKINILDYDKYINNYNEHTCFVKY